MLFLITGPDAFLVREAVRGIVLAHDADGLNTSRIDATASNLEEIIAALGTPGFFGGSRVVIVNDLMSLGSKGSADGEEKGGRSALKINWGRVFGSIQPANVALLVDRQLSTVPSAVKRAVLADAEIVAGDPPRGHALIAWMRQRAEALNSSIADIEARWLAELLCPTTWATRPNNPAYDRPPQLDLFDGELTKLATFAHPGPIEREHISLLTMQSQPDRMFPLIDATFKGDLRAAGAELRVAAQSDDEASRLANQLFQVAELTAALAAAGRTDPNEVGSQLGLSNPARMQSIGRNAGRFRAKPEELIARATTVERQVKSGELRGPVEAAYALVDRISRPLSEQQEGGR